jgi:flagellar biosynthesis component FlhA
MPRTRSKEILQDFQALEGFSEQNDQKFAASIARTILDIFQHEQQLQASIHKVIESNRQLVKRFYKLRELVLRYHELQNLKQTKWAVHQFMQMLGKYRPNLRDIEALQLDEHYYALKNGDVVTAEELEQLILNKDLTPPIIWGFENSDQL